MSGNKVEFETGRYGSITDRFLVTEDWLSKQNNFWILLYFHWRQYTNAAQLYSKKKTTSLQSQDHLYRHRGLRWNKEWTPGMELWKIMIYKFVHRHFDLVRFEIIFKNILRRFLILSFSEIEIFLIHGKTNYRSNVTAMIGTLATAHYWWSTQTLGALEAQRCYFPRLS